MLRLYSLPGDDILGRKYFARHARDGHRLTHLFQVRAKVESFDRHANSSVDQTSERINLQFRRG